MASLLSSASHTSCNHGSHIGLSPCATATSKFLYHYLGYGLIQHHTTQLDRDP